MTPPPAVGAVPVRQPADPVLRPNRLHALRRHLPCFDIELLAEHVEGTRGRPERSVNREVVMENQPGVFALLQKWT
jgi:hypothetical protein